VAPSLNQSDTPSARTVSATRPSTWSSTSSGSSPEASDAAIWPSARSRSERESVLSDSAADEEPCVSAALRRGTRERLGWEERRI
jgi:hypothetical protein